MLGILLIDKPRGLTSHDVVNTIRRKLGTRRVGHAGSLDPMAIGALVVAVGPATRFLQYLPLEPKEYLATVRFGMETDTQDAEGVTIRTGPVPDDLPARLAEALPSFLGPIQQVPPMFSAVKRDGKPLYAYAREGKEIERSPRTVYVEAFDQLGPVDDDSVDFRVVCSGGTYVRTLAHDLGRHLGSGAHLSGLQRIRVGRFRLEDSVPLEAATQDDLISLNESIAPMPIVGLDGGRTRDVREGRTISVQAVAGTRLVALADPEANIFAVARIDGNRAHPECVIPEEAMHAAI